MGFFHMGKILMPFFERYAIMNVTYYYQKYKKWKRNYARLRSLGRNRKKLGRALGAARSVFQNIRKRG